MRAAMQDGSLGARRALSRDHLDRDRKRRTRSGCRELCACVAEKSRITCNRGSELAHSAVLQGEMSSHSSKAPAPKVDNSKVCIGCGAIAPPADEDTTLISISHGWRCVRGVNSSNQVVIEWRCPTCWVIHRSKAPVSERRPKT
jgi:hypothetical protein